MGLYLDKHAKDDSWREISRNLNTNTDVKEALKNIWSQYVLKRVKEMRSGAATGVCVPPFVRQQDWLGVHVKYRQTDTNMPIRYVLVIHPSVFVQCVSLGSYV
jgi:hypothetical protein